MENIITIDEEKCVGCNKCIRNCLVRDANYAYCKNGENKVGIDTNKCLLCGKCIEVCDHDARDFADDLESFFEDLKKGQKIAVIAAPAIRNNFMDYEYIFGFLKAQGVDIIYDVSFGADITTWGYLKAIKEKKLETVIAQPCPVVVNYVEKYKPELINYLAPIHSPMACTAIYMKKYDKYNGKIAFLSPCIAKIDEIRDTNTFGYINYNVTYKKLKKYIEENNINLRSYDKHSFDDIGSGLGLVFSRPGGLKENVEARVKGAWIRQVEGHENAYKYLDEYALRVGSRKPVPLLVDVLNCSHGCNIGTGTTKEVEVDDADFNFNALKAEKLKERKGKLMKRRMDWLYGHFDKNLDIEDFARRYNVKKVTELKTPTNNEIGEIFNKMHKTTSKDQALNCSACGNNTCKQMAISIFNELNYIENCTDYNRKEVVFEKNNFELKNKELEAKNEEINNILGEVNRLSDERLKATESLKGIIKTLSETTDKSSKSVEEVNLLFEQIAESTNNVSTFAKEVSGSVNSVVIAMKEISLSLNEISKNCIRSKVITGDAETKAYETNTIIDNLNTSSKQIAKIVKVIDDIADQTNMLALNAAIEAAGAGEAGKGFAVVADEVKELAKQTAESTEEIGNQIDVMQDSMTSAVHAMGTISLVIDEITSITSTIAASIAEQSAVSGDISGAITTAADKVTMITEKIKEIAKGTREASEGISEVTKYIKELSESTSKLS